MSTVFHTIGITVEDDDSHLTAALWRAEMDYQGTAKDLAQKAAWLIRDLTKTVENAEKAGQNLNYNGINSLGDAQGAADVNRLCAVLEAQRATCMTLRYVALKSGAATENA